ncbi:hypothetical protein HYV82_05235 [Candidatus Woesearchaeota archaeon]|nr:hypothetical protein [Candidatus Woesearchaeota archaeon]
MARSKGADRTFGKSFMERLAVKSTISKEEAVMIADMVKRGMSVNVMRDIESLKRARSKVLLAKQS